MNKKTVEKIILGIIIFTSVISFSQAIYPKSIFAATNSQLNWDNPNQGTKPYQFKAKDFLNSQMIMQIVGCTGVVDKVSEKITTFVKDFMNGDLKEKAKEKVQEKEKEATVETCKAVAGSLSTASGAVPQVTLSNVILYMLGGCDEVSKVEDEQQKKLAEKELELEKAAKKREECYNGIAYTLAKNQLTAMTRNTVNWVNSGFNGDPFYVQNITSLTNSIEKNILEREINKFTDPNMAYPYGTDFSRSVINSYKVGGSLRSGVNNFTDNLVSDLATFLNFTPTYENTGYYSNTGEYGLETTQTAQQRAKEANDAFANDFAVGGWNGYMALTQRDQNNPLGFTMLASQSLADQESEKIDTTKEELATNSGFISQKQCVLWQEYDEEGKPVTEYSVSDDMNLYVFNKNPSSSGKDKCVKEVVVTPGELIKDKISSSLGSSERQLELADDINSVLNSVFSYLIDKLQSQGLSNLSSDTYVYSNRNMSVGSDFTNSIDSDFGEIDSAFSSGSGYTNGSFDLTRDLGNTYIHNARKSLGSWDAKNNIPELYPNTPPSSESINVSYTVSVAGNTQLIDEGFNGWAVGDRAFWNGKTWQNWKKEETNPIKERGVIQIQKDYVVAAKEMLKKLPTIMPKIGELDYCIPGPNPNWEANSSDTYSLFQDYAGTLSYTPTIGGFLERDGSAYSIAKPGSNEYNNYKDVFSWTTSAWWKKIIETPIWKELNRLGTLEPIKDDDIETYNQQQIMYQQEKVGYDFDNFRKVFGQQMNYLYGKNSIMLKPFIENEATGELEENKAYLEMAESGLDITKDIVSYNEDITEAIEDYKEAVIQANLNVGKLQIIKDQVSVIIKKAQDRRDAKLLEIIKKEKCDEQYNKCISKIALESTSSKNFSLVSKANAANYSTTCDAEYTACMEAPITQADKIAYEVKYAECFEEENINYLDENDIMGGTGGENNWERCHNGLDDDLDEYIDGYDSDCEDYFGGSNENNGGDIGYCNENVTTTTSNLSNTPSCGSVNTKNICNSYIYYHNGFQTTCTWTETGGGGTGGTSLYGCKIKQGGGHYVTHEDNIHCDLRTVEACTQTPYYTNNQEYTCEYLPI